MANEYAQRVPEYAMILHYPERTLVMGTPRTRPDIMRYLELNSGKHVHIQDMERELRYTKVQIQNQMRNMIAEGFPIKVIVKAATWIYAPEPDTAPEPESTTGRIYEEIGRTGAGSPILKDENGGVWIGRSIE